MCIMIYVYYMYIYIISNQRISCRIAFDPPCFASKTRPGGAWYLACFGMEPGVSKEYVVC